MPFKLPISPLERINEHPGKTQGISLFIKRDDLLHPEIQGSKARKLSALLPMIQQSFPGGLVTLGGAFSNHLHAVAAAGRLFGIPTVGLLRGEYADLQNPTLQFCKENGMRLQPLPKAEYDAMKQAGASGRSNPYPDHYFMPEGGNTPEAVAACMEIPAEISTQLLPDHSDSPRYLCTPAGTGCTAAGIVAGLTQPNSHVLIFPVSSHHFNPETILRLLPAGTDMESRFSILHDYTFGGFAKFHLPVMQFVRDFYPETNILPDPIYTAKMLFGVFDLLSKAYFPPGSTVIVLHTGGLQGWEGFRARYGEAGTPTC
jgi:1-aminocyclopropane-1-carboxylate deaminase